MSPKIFKFSDLNVMDYTSKKSAYRGEAVGDITFAMGPEIMEQRTGPSNFPIEAEVGSFNSEVSVACMDYNPELLEVIGAMGNVVNSVSGGLVTEIVNQVGEVYAPTGKLITALALDTDTSKIRSGLYRVEYEGAGVISVYAITSIDLQFSEYLDYKTRKVGTGTIANAASLDLGMGVKATCASTVTLADAAIGDSFTFRAFAPGVESNTLEIGNPKNIVPKVSLSVLGRRIEDGRWSELFLERVLLSGFNAAFVQEFGQNEITGRGLYDHTAGRVGAFYTFRGQ